MPLSEIQELLKKNVVFSNENTTDGGGGIPVTHVSLMQPYGRYHLSGTDLEEFMRLYQKDIWNGTCKYGIAETARCGYRPIMADFDLKVEETDDMDIEGGYRLYNENDVHVIVGIFNEMMSKIFSEIKDEDKLCVVLEKPPYVHQDSSGKRWVKNGFHLHWPNFLAEKSHQKAYLYPFVCEEIRKHGFFNKIMSDSSMAVDTAVINVPWLLYGSMKSENSGSYEVSYCLDATGQKKSVVESLCNIKLIGLDGKRINISPDNVVYNLPLILSVVAQGRETKSVNMGIKSPIKEIVKKKTVKNNNKNTVTENLATMKRLLPLLSNERVENYTDWIQIGWIAFNIGDDSGEAFNIWNEWSRSSSKYDEAECICQWDRMIKRDLGIGTLIHYVQRDNPTEYKKWKDETSTTMLDELINNPTHYDVAKFLYTEYGKEFVCANIRSNSWYYFNGNTWEDIDDGSILRDKLSNDIWQKVESTRKGVHFKIYENDSNSDSKFENDRQHELETISKIQKCLKTTTFKKNVMHEAKDIFYDAKFIDKLDQNPYLIAYKNGVYDFNGDYFREGRPEDFISKSLPIEYKEFNWDDEEVEMVDDFFKKTIPDNEVRAYFLNHYAQLFKGGNTFKRVLFWTGVGDNGKSIMQKLFEKMLGTLSCKMDSIFFSGKKQSIGQATPELTRIKPPCRHVVMEEPNADERLNTGNLKKFTGGDSFYTRELYQAGKTMKEVIPMMEMTFVCNKLPPIDQPDKAVWNRVKVIPFESVFVDPEHCPETLEEQMRQKIFPVDRNFESKIPRMITALAWYLLQHRNSGNQVPEPLKVKHATGAYSVSNDVYKEYINENIQEEEGSTIHVNQIYNNFKEWYKNSYSTNTVPPKNLLKEYFIRLWGEPEGKILQWENKAFTENVY